MLRYFRHIRKKLIEQDKVRIYIWYALGEVILVVIGILIALQVNNWNEERKDRILSDVYIYRIAQDLDRLIERSEFQSRQNREILTSITETQRLLERGTQLSNSEKQTVDYAMIWFPRTTYQLPSLLTYEEMKDSGNLNLIHDITIRNQLAELYNYLLQIESTFVRLAEDTDDQFEMYNNYIRSYTDPETLNITHVYDFEAMSMDDEFINTFSRMSVHWRGFVFFMERVNRLSLELKDAMNMSK